MGQKEQERNRKIVEQITTVIFSAKNIESACKWFAGLFRSLGDKISKKVS